MTNLKCYRCGVPINDSNFGILHPDYPDDELPICLLCFFNPNDPPESFVTIYFRDEDFEGYEDGKGAGGVK